MIKFDITNRWSGRVLFTAEIDCDENVSRSVKIGLATKWGVANGASLWGANLGDASLRGADLGGANLWGANLRGADLRDATLWGATLWGANLRDADLRDAAHIFTFGPIGQDRRTGTVSIKDGKPVVHLGCFTGTEKEALEAITKKYGPRSSYALFVRGACAEARTLIKSLPKEPME